MKRVKDALVLVWNHLDGWKTFLVGVAGLIWGLYQRDTNTILAALALMGLRDALRKLK